MSTPERRGLLGNEDSPSPIPATTPSPALQFAARHRPGYARVPSVSFNSEVIARDITDQPSEDETTPATEASGRRHGLGIQGVSSPTASVTRSHLRRVSSPLAQQEYSSHERTPVMSPPSTGGFSGTTFNQSFDSDFDTSYGGVKPKDSRTSVQSTAAPSIYAKSDTGLLSTRSRYDFEPHNCPSTKAIKHGRFRSWLSIGILLLAVFSTIFSLIFLVLAIMGPHYGRNIRESGGSLTPSSAAFLTSFFAKMIELSFVTVIVAFVGQALARRAFKEQITRGVTLAEMSMRTWVMQPGTMFTQWESVRYAGISALGAVSLLAALMALLYTTASTALVQPQLKWPDWSTQTMQGLVKTMFANSMYIGDNCHTPQRTMYNKGDTNGLLDEKNTCLDITHAAMAYHNYYTYMDHWTQTINNGTGSIPLSRRPKGYALFNDNTTVTSPWIEQQNVTWINETRWINNVTMAMPHLGVVQAAMDPKNGLVQPTDVDGAMYNVIASVPSPFINVLCMTLTADDLVPFVYELWHDGPKTVNTTLWPYNLAYKGRNAWLNQTGTDIAKKFGWGPEYGDIKYPPVFPKLPKDYNTLLNDTTGAIPSWGRKTIYVLGKGPPEDTDGVPMVDANGNGTNYALCQLQVGLTAACSTHYNASVSGAQIEAVCEDENDPFQYSRSNSDAIIGNATLSAEWPNIAGEWARSISLKDGIIDGDSANNRQLTQLIVNTQNLSTALPSMAEALAVMAGCTVMESIVDSPFVAQTWNYTLPTVEPGQYQYFNASVRSQQYASGGALPYQKAFFPVLFIVFIMSFLALLYFLWHRDWYTDFSEPATLFALSLNSPPSEKLAGSCGCGPSGTQYQVPWKLNNDGGHIYVDSHEVSQDSVSVSSPRLSRRRWTENFDMLGTPMSTLKSRFSRDVGQPTV